MDKRQQAKWADITDHDEWNDHLDIMRCNRECITRRHMGERFRSLADHLCLCIDAVQIEMSVRDLGKVAKIDQD